jgi:hypothetical protein
MKKTSKKNRLAKKTILVIGILFLLSGIGFIGYFLYSSIHSWQPNPDHYSKVQQDQDLIISQNNNYISVLPKDGGVSEGLIIYQGAFADAKSYIAPYSGLVKQGIGVFIIRSSFGFALFNVGGANAVINNNPEIKNWYVAGHSLGGVAACEYTKANSNKIKGLIMLASFCNGNAKDLKTDVLSISGTNDGLSTPEKIDNSRSKLPDSTKYVVVDGANHTEFGDLEKLQPGDKEATITQEEATEQIINAILNFVR